MGSGASTKNRTTPSNQPAKSNLKNTNGSGQANNGRPNAYDNGPPAQGGGQQQPPLQGGGRGGAGGTGGDGSRDQPRRGSASGGGGAPRMPPYYRDNPRDDGRNTPRPVTPYRPGGPSAGRPSQGQRSRTFEERARLMDELDRIADQTLANPPGAIYSSRSYDASYEYYNERVTSGSQEELDGWLDMELDTLKHNVVDDLLRSQYSMDDLRAVQDSPQVYEFRLQLAALVHVFKREDNEWERFNYQMENERQQDLEFLRSLQERVERGTQRPVVMGTMSDYAKRYGDSSDGGGGGRGSGNVYPAAGVRRTGPQAPNATRRQPSNVAGRSRSYYQ